MSYGEELAIQLCNYISALEKKLEESLNKVNQYENKSKTEFDDLPDVLQAKDIANFLHIGKTHVYEYLKTPVEAGGIRSFRYGKQAGAVRCMKSDFISWIKSRSKNQ